jgi:hypothetical protein
MFAIAVKTCAIDAKTSATHNETAVFRIVEKMFGTDARTCVIVGRMSATVWKTASIEIPG